MSATDACRTLLSVICEAILEARVVEDAQRLGAHGYTVSDARGWGRHGARDGHWPMSGNVRIDILCEPAVADAIAGHLEASYFSRYAIVCYLSQVRVLRPGKF